MTNGPACSIVFRDNPARFAVAPIEEATTHHLLMVLALTDWPYTTLKSLKIFGLRREYFL